MLKPAGLRKSEELQENFSKQKDSVEMSTKQTWGAQRSCWHTHPMHMINEGAPQRRERNTTVESVGALYAMPAHYLQ